MTKKLKIRFVKFECALAMQILEQEGKFARTEHVHRSCNPELRPQFVYLRGHNKSDYLHPAGCSFDSNEERDEYLAKVVGWITDEQFMNGSGELKIGERCEFADDLDGEWCDGKLLFILPPRYGFRYIFATDAFLRGWTFAQYARPFAQRIEPKIDGDVYTWSLPQ